MGIKQTTYQPRPDATPERERSVLAEVYALILEDHAAREAAEEASNGGDGIATEVSAE